MKLYAARAADTADLEILWPLCSFESPEHAVAAFSRCVSASRTGRAASGIHTQLVRSTGPLTLNADANGPARVHRRSGREQGARGRERTPR
jgi:hypothetical protein